MVLVLLVLFLWSTHVSCTDKWVPQQRPIPADFLFGASTAAHQVEGGRSLHGRTDSIWDIYLDKHVTKNGSEWEDAANSIENVRRDITMLRELGVDFYKFSISWSRILPSGFPNNVKEAGITYYESIFHLLQKYNIEPMVVMYNADLPQTLQNLGGWANPSIVQWFQDYANILLTRFNKDVKYWITFNDPSSCFLGYGGKDFPPEVNMQSVADYMCIKNMLISHGKVYRLFEKKFKPLQKNEMGISVTINGFMKNHHQSSKDGEDKAFDHIWEIAHGLILHPIFSETGDFPRSIKTLVKSQSEKEGYPRSRLPALSSEEVKLLRGASDFLGINHETTWFVESTKNPSPNMKFPDICCVNFTQPNTWSATKVKDIKSYAYGLYYTWFTLQKQYGHVNFFITELGWPYGKGLMDKKRVENMRQYMQAVLYALYDGAKVRGIAFRSLMDGIEGTRGTSIRYGLYETDFISSEKSCRPRASAVYLRHLIDTRLVTDVYEIPQQFKLNISDRRLSKDQKVQNEMEDIQEETMRKNEMKDKQTGRSKTLPKKTEL